jgi:hypothetical protein
MKKPRSARWDLLLRSEGGGMMRLTALKGMYHTNADLVRAVERDFIPRFRLVTRRWKRLHALQAKSK